MSRLSGGDKALISLVYPPWPSQTVLIHFTASFKECARLAQSPSAHVSTRVTGERWLLALTCKRKFGRKLSHLISTGNRRRLPGLWQAGDRRGSLCQREGFFAASSLLSFLFFSWQSLKGSVLLVIILLSESKSKLPLEAIAHSRLSRIQKAAHSKSLLFVL